MSMGWRFAVIALALLFSSAAMGWTWEAGTVLTVVAGDKATVVGVGEVENGELSLTLSRGFSGVAVLIVETPEGEMFTFDVVVEAGGDVLFGDEGEFMPLGESVARAGLAYRVGVGAPAVAAGRGGAAGGGGAEGAPLDRAKDVADEKASNGLERAREVAGPKVGGGQDRGGGPSEKEEGIGLEVPEVGIGEGAVPGVGGRGGNGRD